MHTLSSSFFFPIINYDCENYQFQAKNVASSFSLVCKHPAGQLGVFFAPFHCFLRLSTPIKLDFLVLRKQESNPTAIKELEEGLSKSRLLQILIQTVLLGSSSEHCFNYKVSCHSILNNHMVITYLTQIFSVEMGPKFASEKGVKNSRKCVVMTHTHFLSHFVTSELSLTSLSFSYNHTLRG